MSWKRRGVEDRVTLLGRGGGARGGLSKNPTPLQMRSRSWLRRKSPRRRRMVGHVSAIRKRPASKEERDAKEKNTMST